ncbi:MAG: 3-deoxy-D-manno-octulosonic acid transferase [Syntrophales bacterium]|jgi:3-deoxy-D-manno-octulosonic-acid transferase|nr:3-deoxy-D-manno-octulosonic acid transferase [Syntrophales bacterium]MCK9528696.1 3-deoxy-D-manno-octulosonic acid transferase [Syntrophales bacterium]MDX9922649.1 3-deoxy-D-manno-octulosonic acid transferase [Syntrophales bacterium]
MNMIAYNAVLSAAALAAVPWFAWKVLAQGKYRESAGPKLGFHRHGTFENAGGSPRIWIHAVSVGEVTAAAPIVARLRRAWPDAALLLSTSTETGRAAARRLVPEATVLFYYPLDIPPVIRKVMDRVNPDLFVTVETELWPNFLHLCRERSVKTVMVNGRLSPRSFKNYRATRFFWKHVLGFLDSAGVISETDGSRLRELGMDSSRITVLGNAKYDGLVERADAALGDETARMLSLARGTPVIVAGSTHEGEEKILVRAYRRLLKELPGLVLVLAPRHVERTAAVLSLLKEEQLGRRAVRLSRIDAGEVRGDRSVIVVDVMGRLFSLYGTASLVFCGGSLVPKGGQNVLEAAAWGKVVIHGPSMDDFREEGRLLADAEAGVTVRDGKELAGRMAELLGDPEECRRRGEAGRRIVAENQGAADRYVELISGLVHTGT